MEVQLDFFARNPEAEICQTEEIWIRNGRRVNPRTRNTASPPETSSNLPWPCVWSALRRSCFRRGLLDQAGPFDPRLPACEDYDLWLRIACRRPVFLIDQPLVIKRGGHPDQLSRTIPALDRYRIASLLKLLQAGDLTDLQCDAAVKELKRKCRIYGQGCLKRGRIEEGNYYLELPKRMKPARSGNRI